LVALNEEAKNTFDFIPYEVYFSNNQACTGGTETVPEYRGRGLMVYGYFERFKFLREMGFQQVRLRHHGKICRIEVAAAEMGPFFDRTIQNKVVDYLKNIGYQYVTLDMEGYRCGARNEVLDK